MNKIIIPLLLLMVGCTITPNHQPTQENNVEEKSLVKLGDWDLPSGHLYKYMVEVVKDRELAQRLQKMSSRGTYGAHRGLNSKGALSPTVSVKSLGIADDVRVAKIRGRAVELFELCGAERAERYLKEQAVSRLLSERQAERIFKEIKEELSPVTQPAQPVSKYNPYGKAEPRLPKPLVSDDVLYLFRNWKH